MRARPEQRCNNPEDTLLQQFCDAFLKPLFRTAENISMSYYFILLIHSPLWMYEWPKKE